MYVFCRKDMISAPMTDHDVWLCHDDVYDVVLGSLIKTYKWHAHAPYRLSHKSQLVWSLFAILYGAFCLSSGSSCPLPRPCASNAF